MSHPDFLHFDAWLFDMDGVVTDTAHVHATSWKQMFDEYLKAQATQNGTEFQEFTIEGDYHTFVDGKPRYEGVDSFLKSRGIELPWGDVADSPDASTVCGLGNRKNVLFNDILARDGAVLFESSVKLIKALKAKGKKVAVVTSSKNCDTVLNSVDIKDIFDVQVDGIVAAEKKLPGKPNPDTYAYAAHLLDTPLEKAVVIEDAISGVQAGKTGGFGLVIGVDRFSDGSALKANGATISVSDLEEIQIAA